MKTEDTIAAYNKAAREYARSRIGTEDMAELEKFRKLLEYGSKVLDVGCAAGRDTRILKDMGLDVFGVDLADKLIAIAKKSNPDITFALADMRQLPFEDGAFDALWVSAVLHHLEKTGMQTALQEFNRVLAPHGILYVHTKAGSGKLKTNEDTVSGQEREFELVIRKELETMLSEAGYSKISLEEKVSKSRPGLIWINALYAKDA